MRLYRRENYLQKIRGFYNDTGMIKVITGVRRCGKSCLMHTIAEELMEQGISQENITFIDLKRHGYKSVKTADELDGIIERECRAAGTKYLFIDEIQNVSGFESVLEAYREEEEYSIFITGSNSYLLSGELSSQLTGRYIEFEMFTLSYEEYIGMKKFYGKHVDSSSAAEIKSYILEGGFPKSLEYDTLPDKRRYVSSVIQEIFEKDIKRRTKIRNTEIFQSVQRYVINNFGSTTSISNMLADLNKEGMTIKRETLNRYIQVLVDAKIIYECHRFDLKSRRSIRGEEKYYLADLSFFFATNTDNRINYGPVLENIVYQYAKSKDYAVSVGRIGNLECDFIFRDTELNYSYAQVAMTIMSSEETENREYRPLEKIDDNYPKYVLTLDELPQKRSGIHHMNIPEFMINGTKF